MWNQISWVSRGPRIYGKAIWKIGLLCTLENIGLRIKACGSYIIKLYTDQWLFSSFQLCVCLFENRGINWTDYKRSCINIKTKLLQCVPIVKWNWVLCLMDGDLLFIFANYFPICINQFSITWTAIGNWITVIMKTWPYVDFQFWK